MSPTLAASMLALALSTPSICASAAETSKAQGLVIELSAEASRAAPNDLAHATVYAEAAEASPAELTKRVNSTIAGALQTVKAYPSVNSRSGAANTYPNYGKDGRIVGWRARSELELESRDMSALSELMGKLQSHLAVGNLALMPAPETRRKAEDEAVLEAIGAFQARAKLVAAALKKPYRIRQMSIGHIGAPPVTPLMRATGMVATEAGPVPIDPGKSALTVTVSGQIELSE